MPFDVYIKIKCIHLLESHQTMFLHFKILLFLCICCNALNLLLMIKSLKCLWSDVALETDVVQKHLFSVQHHQLVSHYNVWTSPSTLPLLGPKHNRHLCTYERAPCVSSFSMFHSMAHAINCPSGGYFVVVKAKVCTPIAGSTSCCCS